MARDQLEDGPSRYLESWVYRLRGPLDVAAVRAALQLVVSRHEALHSGLTIVAGQPGQLVYPVPELALPVVTTTEPELPGLLVELVSQPMDLTLAPLRATLVQLADRPDDAVLGVQVHHAVVDDWALAVLDQEFGEAYRAQVQGRAPQLPELPIQMGEYAARQRDTGTGEDTLRYWHRQLDGVPELSSFPADRVRPVELSSDGDLVRFPVPPALAGRVRRQARTSRTTPFAVLTAALTALVYQAGEQSDIVIGAPVSRRGSVELDGLIGCATDLLPLRQQVADGMSFGDLVGSSTATARAALAHRDIAFSELVRRTVTSAELDRAPLCQVVLVVDDAPRVPLDLPGVQAERVYVHSGRAKFDLLLTLVVDGSGYQGFLEYSRDLFDHETARRITEDWLQLLDQLLGDPEAALPSRRPDRPSASRTHP